MLTPEELQAIRDRSTFVPDGTGAAWMRYTSPAPEDRTALLAHIDATEGEGSDRTRAVQILARIISGAGGAPDGTITGLAAQVEALLQTQRDQLASWAAITDAWNAGACAACARLPRTHVLHVYDEQAHPELFRAWLGGWDADAWAPGGPEYAARQEQIDALTPRWLPAPPIGPPETEAWVWMEHRVDPVRVRACREGAADVLWWDDDEIEVEDPPYQRAVGWRLWVGNGEGRRWAPCTGRPG